MKHGKKLLALTVLLAIVMMTWTITYAPPVYLEPSGWTVPIAVDVDDPGNSPQTGLGDDDAKGTPGQPANELLTVYVDWDSTYIYVRWDIELDYATDAQKLSQVYYVLSIDTTDLTTPPHAATRILQFEVGTHVGSSMGPVTVTVRDAASPSPALWSDVTTSHYSVNDLGGTTALEGKYPWAQVTASGVPADILLLRAESHASDPSSGLSSEVMDYIDIGGDPVPWFTSLPMALLTTMGLVVFIKKRKALPVF